jgi:hypothetical protein
VGSGTFSTPLSGTSFGFDFNPVVDRIRVVSDAEQNLRLNPDTGAVAAVDSSLNPAGSVVAAAYTNSFPSAATTTLFGIDSGSDMLVLIGGLNGTPSANGGVVSNVGPLGVDTTSLAGLDIATAHGVAYAALNVGGVARLYTLSLTIGAATLVGTIGGGAIIRGIAILDTFCNPRPNVGVTVVPATAGRLAVTVTAVSTAGTPGNTLASINFAATNNGLIDIPGGVTGSSGGFSLPLPPGTTETTFHIRQASPGGVTVPFTVTDVCGGWQTFAGGGTAAFAAAGAVPPPGDASAGAAAPAAASPAPTPVGVSVSAAPARTAPSAAPAAAAPSASAMGPTSAAPDRAASSALAAAPPAAAPAVAASAPGQVAPLAGPPLIAVTGPSMAPRPLLAAPPAPLLYPAPLAPPLALVPLPPAMAWGGPGPAAEVPIIPEADTLVLLGGGLAGLGALVGLRARRSRLPGTAYKPPDARTKPAKRGMDR